MRGNQRNPSTTWQHARSIPAYAGEPFRQSRRLAVGGVYPRVCGGTRRTRALLRQKGGLSPRMRGNPTAIATSPSVTGSIPAYAGEPTGGRIAPPPSRVYPRVCGGTRTKSRNCDLSRGLSPRMRGNPAVRQPQREPPGSIPAYAGEPDQTPARYFRRTVYPRVCGGTAEHIAEQLTREGLSPRMRGNRSSSPIISPRRRSIPAYAGEPPPPIPARTHLGVYPRVCGGTRAARCPVATRAGLSPRMRGNPDSYPFLALLYRSIPAYAGEPRMPQSSCCMTGVYPRVCGGTQGWEWNPMVREGLSPRMRGNPTLRASVAESSRSIPAYAGEPRRAYPVLRKRRVYPRVCGGTDSTLGKCQIAHGLSPRMRGNRYG